jgi:N-acetyl-anhydromuramyl-L-alanine amidase AmpD
MDDAMAPLRIRPSPNFNSRHGTAISAIVLHATADRDTAASVQWCCTPAPKNPKPVSYHSIIDRDATLFSLVDVLNRAWHAGYSSFKGVGNVNDYAIGLSFANANDGIEPYPDAQLAAGAALVAGYMRRFPAITIDRITTHAVVRAEWHQLFPGHPEVEVKTDPAPPAFDLVAFKVRVARELLKTPPLATGAP